MISDQWTGSQPFQNYRDDFMPGWMQTLLMWFILCCCSSCHYLIVKFQFYLIDKKHNKSTFKCLKILKPFVIKDRPNIQRKLWTPNQGQTSFSAVTRTSTIWQGYVNLCEKCLGQMNHSNIITTVHVYRWGWFLTSLWHLLWRWQKENMLWFCRVS